MRKYGREKFFCRIGDGSGIEGYADALGISITAYSPLKKYTAWGRRLKIGVSEVKITNSEKIIFGSRCMPAEPLFREDPNIMYDPLTEGVRHSLSFQRPYDNLRRGYVTGLSVDVKCP